MGSCCIAVAAEKLCATEVQSKIDSSCSLHVVTLFWLLLLLQSCQPTVCTAVPAGPASCSMQMSECVGACMAVVPPLHGLNQLHVKRLQRVYMYIVDHHDQMI